MLSNICKQYCIIEFESTLTYLIHQKHNLYLIQKNRHNNYKNYYFFRYLPRNKVSTAETEFASKKFHLV